MSTWRYTGFVKPHFLHTILYQMNYIFVNSSLVILMFGAGYIKRKKNSQKNHSEFEYE